MSENIYTLEDLEGRKFLPKGKYAGIISGTLSGTTAKGTRTVRFLIRRRSRSRARMSRVSR